MSASALHAGLGLARNPFPPTPDAESYFFTPRLHEQFTELQHCIQARKGFVLLTGEVGLGKSTLVRHLLDTLPDDTTRSALVFNTFLQGDALLAAIVRDFGLAPTGSLDGNLERLNRFLLDEHRAGRTCLLVIDDAQNLNADSLELVRLLCNLETAQEKLLQILLAGQPELEVALADRSLRQLQSRVVQHTRLSTLDRSDVSRYFDFRTTAAGSAGRLVLQPAAARLLHTATGGNVRRIHLVLDRCLYGLSAQGRDTIDAALVRAALRDLGQSPPARPSSLRRFWPMLAAAGALAGLTGWAGATHWRAPAPAPVARMAAASVAQQAAAPATATATVTATATPPCDISGPADARQSVGAEAARRLRGVPGLCIASVADGWQAFWTADAAAPLLPQAVALGAAPDESTRRLQQALAARGHLPPTEIDGYYGAHTASALAQFQAAHGLAVSVAPDALSAFLLARAPAFPLPAP